MPEGTSQTTWPNWVDLVILIVFFRSCYVGFGRGLLAEVLSLVGLVSATAIACNFHGFLAQWLSRWWPGDVATLDFLTFLLVFILLLLLVRVVIVKFAEALKWERLHWMIQGVGMVLGGVRGLWWMGLILLVLLSLGIPYFKGSIQDRSILGPRFVKVAQQVLEVVAQRFPGYTEHAVLIPAIKVPLPELPQKLNL